VSYDTTGDAKGPSGVPLKAGTRVRIPLGAPQDQWDRPGAQHDTALEHPHVRPPFALTDDMDLFCGRSTAFRRNQRWSWHEHGL